MKKARGSKSYMCLICDGVSAETGVQITVSALHKCQHMHMQQ